jgi:hypothetical protein
MPNYRVEMWVSHSDSEAEDLLERRIADAVSGDGVRVVEGPVVFRLFTLSDPVHDRPIT